MEIKTTPGLLETSALIKSLSIEIILSQIAFTVVIFPLVMLVVPTMLVIDGLTSVAGISSVFGGLTSLLEQPGFGWGIGFANLCIGCAIYIRSLLSKDAGSRWKKRSRPLPESWGEAIEGRIGEIWSDLQQRDAAPKIYWFPALDIAAYTANKNGPQIYVSAALAQALLRDDAKASAIVAHEMGHLTKRDSQHFLHMRAMIATTQFSLWVVASVGLLTISGNIIKNVYQQFSGQVGLTDMLAEQMAVLFVGFNWFFVFAILGWLAVSRHAALITALIEIRADIVAANWTGGLESFTQAFALARSGAKSERWGWLTALVSPRLTHLPREERLSLMRNAAAIAVPKLNYYLASIALISFLPLNFLVPGYIAHFSSFFMALLIQMLVVIMLMVAPKTALSSTSTPSKKFFRINNAQTICYG